MYFPSVLFECYLPTVFLGAQFKSFWTKSTGNDRICATIIRKLTETAGNELTPAEAQPLADHLNHSVTTALNNYKLHDKQKKAGRMSRHIQ